MACEICEHCQGPVSRDERVTVHEGFSYHKKCHKCYVCSETNLQNAEVFKGVIFCSSCAQRIFQGCSTARKTKNAHAHGRIRRTRSKHRRERVRAHERRLDRSRDGVIELAGLAGSTTTESEDTNKNKCTKPSKTTFSAELALQVGKETNEENSYLRRMKKDSIEMGTTTDVTQELLMQINCPIPECRANTYSPQTLYHPKRHRRRRDHVYHPNNKPVCSDLRIAELGASTEIANMALRKKSEVPVIIRSDSRLKQPSYSLSVLNQESEESGDGSDWIDTYSSMDDSVRTRVMDRRLGSILKLPLKMFKKNILTRSSLISILISNDDHRNINFIRRLKRMLTEEVTEHRGRGMQRLYSTINRRRTPYKLGWLEHVAKVSRAIREQSSFCTCDKRCRHFEASHSYRCMRTQVMRLAGPTNSELACYRNKIKKCIVPPFLRSILGNDKDAAIKMSQACGSDRRSIKL